MRDMLKSELFPGLKRYPRKDGTERLIWSCSKEARRAGFGHLTANLSRLGKDQDRLSEACKRYDAMQSRFLAVNYSSVAGHIEREQIEKEIHHWILFSGNRAKHRGVEITIDKAYLVQLVADQDWCCALSRIPFKARALKTKGRAHCNPFALSVDRIDGSRGYVPGNVRIVCNIVNFALNSFSDEDFFFMCRRVAELHPGRVNEHFHDFLERPQATENTNENFLVG